MYVHWCRIKFARNLTWCFMKKKLYIETNRSQDPDTNQELLGSGTGINVCSRCQEWEGSAGLFCSIHLMSHLFSYQAASPSSLEGTTLFQVCCLPIKMFLFGSCSRKLTLWLVAKIKLRFDLQYLGRKSLCSLIESWKLSLKYCDRLFLWDVCFRLLSLFFKLWKNDKSFIWKAYVLLMCC